MKRVTILIMVLLLFTMSGCKDNTSPNKTEPNVEATQPTSTTEGSSNNNYEMVIDTSFKTNYNVGDYEPDWKKAVKLMKGDTQVKNQTIVVDTSVVDLNHQGSFTLHYTTTIDGKTYTKDLTINVTDPTIPTVTGITADKTEMKYFESTVITVTINNPIRLYILSATINSQTYHFDFSLDQTTLTLTYTPTEVGDLTLNLEAIQYRRIYDIEETVVSDKSVILTVIDNGDGTQEHPYKIRTAEELDKIRNDLDAYYVLENDLDLTDYDNDTDSSNGNFAPIGDNTHPFTGNLNGKGHVVKNLHMNLSTQNYIGLFGYLNFATVTDLGIYDATIGGQYFVGVITGYANMSTIGHIVSSGDITGTDDVGGIAGYIYDTTVENVIINGNISGQNYIGGAVGQTSGGNHYSRVENVLNYSSVTGVSHVGSLIGVYENLVIQNIYYVGTHPVSIDTKSLVGLNLTREQILDANAYGFATEDWDFVKLNQYIFPQLKVTGSEQLISGQKEHPFVLTTITANKDLYVDDIDKTILLTIDFNNPTSLQVTNVTINGVEYMQFEAGSTASKIIIKIDNSNKVSGKYEYALESITFNGSVPYFLPSTCESNIYENISTINDLLSIDKDSFGYYELQNDLDLSNIENWTPIPGTFNGNFNGNGHTINGLTINAPETDHIGLFSFIGITGNVENLKLTNVNIIGHDYVGAIAGSLQYTISNVSVTGSVSGNEYVGGIVGLNSTSATISRAFVEETSIISGNNYIGGLVGSTFGNIYLSYANVEVSGVNNIGGVAGYNKGLISESYSSGTVTGNSYVGGLVGFNTTVSSDIDNILYSYSASNVTGTYNVGGVLGGNQGTARQVFSLGTVTGYNAVGGIVGFNDDTGHLTILFTTSHVTITGMFGGGIYGRNTGPLSFHYRYEGQVITSDSTVNAQGGTVSSTQLKDSSWYTNLGFSSDYWDFTPLNNGYYIQLKGIETESNILLP